MFTYYSLSETCPVVKFLSDGDATKQVGKAEKYLSPTPTRTPGVNTWMRQEEKPECFHLVNKRQETTGWVCAGDRINAGGKQMVGEEMNPS
jgi:hypothetical protein